MEQELAASKVETARLIEANAQQEATLNEVKRQLVDKEQELAQIQGELSDAKANLAASEVEAARLIEANAQHHEMLTEVEGKLVQKEQELAKAQEGSSDPTKTELRDGRENEELLQQLQSELERVCVCEYLFIALRLSFERQDDVRLQFAI